MSDSLQEKVLQMNRCSKVVKGGRKFSFSALVIVGNGTKVAFGFAKAKEATDAMRKAIDKGSRQLITLPSKEGTITREISESWDGAKILLRPARAGTGIIAGRALRWIFVLGGITDIVTKSQGSRNSLNQVRATFAALEKLRCTS